ncbi:tRNA-(MS[2]IO[6]A)-hydroxylase (MiaE) [Roseimaritima multifibrata]|uniref:tRNA-(MS[2]IO[6]A)-hydroxylase (MiaE) n=1 Tax=Roseimaritima multifibrata TaxID=1930274 RepID=A0A517MB85_9BACT|nr:tRNA-(ms[2]io[6]A)-hydroxylase [Roseimaritima multifibrata]QDS92134.1 tRNA-(MS[2]IO[6]A)-hydroxylase (MiaE) [Roseimaritima multifibrata]
MLHLQPICHDAWLKQVDEDLDQILIDHAYCERKAASTAMALINAYTEDRDLCREMKRIIEEELEHFEMVLEILDARQIEFHRLTPGPYGKSLNECIRKREPERILDRLLVASLIEARSCERFSLLAKHVSQRDPELSVFYAGLFESEARHHTTYVQLAEKYADRNLVRDRLNELSHQEAEIISAGSSLPRMHS